VLAAALALVGTTLWAADEAKRAFTFDKAELGKLPSGWTAAHTGKGEGSVWKVEADDTAPSKTGCALAQTAEGPNPYFNLCVVDDSNYKNPEPSVAFKAMRGKLDQGGGVVWRYQNADNYYVARMHPLEDNFRVYHVIAGKRTQLGTKEDLKVPTGTWHTIRVRQEGDHIECWLDGTKYLDVKDDAIPKAGKVGLWTKADAQTHFDEFRVRELGE
jgi:hypothetical protein